MDRDAHRALIWRENGNWLGPAAAFVREGVSREEPVCVGVCPPAGDALAGLLPGEPLVSFFDMARLGRNPSRIIPAMLDFARRHPGRPLRYLSQPFWAGRSEAACAETVRHEALLGLALAGLTATVMCVYEARRLTGLTGLAVSCAEQTHPTLVSGGESRPSRRYAGPGAVPPPCDPPLSPPPASAAWLTYSDDLRRVRKLVSACAHEAGLASGRITDLVLAASEIAANTLRHGGGLGTLRIWATADEVICQITDPGRIDDPLAGRRPPVSDSRGQGLWVVNQVCDLVELRSGAAGTTVRMHMHR
jgi:anti-sigma regulatory factor (Ser/Thr protein kinase)